MTIGKGNRLRDPNQAGRAYRGQQSQCSCNVIDLNKCRRTHRRKTKPKSIKYSAKERNDFAENVFDPSHSARLAKYQ
jgi:hypothetical protein